MANALASASGWYDPDRAATRTAAKDGRVWPVVFNEECPSVPLSYPENILWFVQASELDGERDKSEGSAVAIRLQELNQPATARTYLLTCGHVVRGTAADGKAGLGRRLPSIRAWPSGLAFNERQARKLVVADQIKGFPSEELAATARSNASDDWVVLKIVEEEDALARSTVGKWALEDLSGDFWICGFLGSESLPGDVVVPTSTPQWFPIRDQDQGSFRLTGDGTRAGFSGGGVFGKNGVFAGIHRGRKDGALQLNGVSAAYIQARLYELGYEVPRRLEAASAGPPRLAVPRRELAEILGDLLASGIDWSSSFAKALPPSSTYEKSAAANTDEELLTHAIDHLAALGADDKEVYPLFRFACDLSQKDDLATHLRTKLETWLRIQCPEEQRRLLSKPQAAEVPIEPRIVIRMVPAPGAENPPGDPAFASSGTPREEPFRYNIWFLGFPNSPSPQEHTCPRDRFGDILEQAWSAVREQSGSGSAWVELFLPKHLFSWAVEKERFRIARHRVLIGTRRFVLRFDRTINSKRLEERCENARARSRTPNAPIRLDCTMPLEAVPEYPGNGQHFMVALDAKADPDGLDRMFYRLEQKASVLGVLWNSPPESSPSDDQLDAWDVVSDTGVPVAIWLRERPPDDGAADLKALFQQKEWDALASEVQRIRLDAATQEQWHVGRSLAVVLDDPRRPLPEASRAARLRSPASTR